LIFGVVVVTGPAIALLAIVVVMEIERYNREGDKIEILEWR